MFKVSDTQFKMPKIFSGIIILLSVAAITLEMVIFLYGNVPELVKIVSVMCMLVILFLIIFMYDILNDYYNEKIRLELLEKEKNYYLNQAELATEHVNEIRKFKHDIKNHLLALDAIMQNDRKGAKEYITELEDRVSSEELYSESDSEIDVILQGVVDLFIKISDDEAIIVDYKTDYVTSKTGEDILRERHKEQLRIYKEAVAEYYQLKNIKTYVYSYVLSKLIEVE